MKNPTIAAQHRDGRAIARLVSRLPMYWGITIGREYSEADDEWTIDAWEEGAEDPALSISGPVLADVCDLIGKGVAILEVANE